jgi:hypothetical protein
VLDADGVDRLVGIGGAFALLPLVAAVAGGASGAVPWALAALGGEYAAWIAVRGGDVDTRSPLYGAGLLLVAELAYWAIDRRSIAHAEAELETRRAAMLLVLLAVSIAVGAVLLAASSLSLGGGAAVEAVGVAAAVALLGIVASLVRTQSEQEREA